MDQLFIEELSNVHLPLDTTANLPTKCYGDDDFFEVEKKEILRKSWLSVGRGDRWINTGDYTAFDLTGVPIIMIRDKSGTLHAYNNACRHRGAMMLEGEGNTKTIGCPFHRWTYDLTGELRGAPDMDRAACFEKADYPLVEFRVAERYGFAFVCFDQDTPDIDAWLGDFNDFHSPWPLESLKSTRRLELEVECNWKGFVEVFNEYYHLPYVHPDSINAVYAAPDAGDTVTGSYATQFGKTEGTGGLLTTTQGNELPEIPGLSEDAASGTRYTWVYPNMTFAASSEAIWIYEVSPISTSKTRVGMTVCFPQETIDHPDFETRAPFYYHRMDAAVDEDIPMLEQQQRGLKSPYAKQGRFCVEQEPNVANFAVWYADKLKKVSNTL